MLQKMFAHTFVWILRFLVRPINPYPGIVSLIKSPFNADASTGKVEKLIKLMEKLVLYLGKYDDLRIHRHVNEFYYLQKKEEFLILLSERSKENGEVGEVNEKLNLLYEQVATNWLNDVRWIKNNVARSEA